ncbi:MAG: hypothetical protein SVX43_18960 [Cyanobacteriota bacterium]|nr:hypothetical protein [Cyanobacteriota bacterium]
MKELLYIEIPTPDTQAVRDWLHQTWKPRIGRTFPTPDGLRWQEHRNTSTERSEIPEVELSLFVWSVQRTTYLKVFRWGKYPPARERQFLQQLIADVRMQFPQRYGTLPTIDLSGQSIFEALTPHYPKTVHFFKKMVKGEYDLKRVYWWEKRWRENVCNPQHPQQVVFEMAEERGRLSQVKVST